MDQINPSISGKDAKAEEDFEKDIAGHDQDTPEDNDPVHVLQFSQPFFAADTLDDDESLMIPPTPDDAVPYLIPSTPSLTQDKKEEEMIPDEAIASALQGLQSDYGKCDFSKDFKLPQKLDLASESFKDTSTLSDVTDDLPDLSKSDLESSSTTLKSPCEKNVKNQPNSNDDDWHLELTGTEGTQGFDLTQDENISTEQLSAEKVESTQEDLSELSKKIDAEDEQPVSKEEPNVKCSPNEVKSSTLPIESITVIESSDDEDEIEPSQTILTQYPGEMIFSSSKMQSQYQESLKGSDAEKPDVVTSEDNMSNNKQDLKENNVDVLDSDGHQTLTQELLDEDTPSQSPVSKVESMEAQAPEIKEVAEKSSENGEKVEEIHVTPKGKVENWKTPLASGIKKTKAPAVKRPKKETLHSDAAATKREFGEQRLVGSFTDLTSLQSLYQSIQLEPEQLSLLISTKPNEERKVWKKMCFTAIDKKLYISESALEIYDPDKPFHFEESPHSSSISTTTSSSSKTSFRSGELGDISSSYSSKSANSSGIQHDTTVTDSSQQLSSQDSSSFMKTSTQNSETQTDLPPLAVSQLLENSGGSGKKTPKRRSSSTVKSTVRSPKILLSPIKYDASEQEVQLPGSKTKRGRKNSSVTSEEKQPKKQKKTKNVKRKTSSAALLEESSETTNSVIHSAEPKKKRKRKRDDIAEVLPQPVDDFKEELTFDLKEVQEVEESHYGNIIPGIRVMAPWTDGYYYTGMVQSQELEGRWSVRFDDGHSRVIPQENLLKLALLTVGTSIFALSPDGHYDPGMVCGHFKEGDNAGYLVELDRGITKRYPRTSVILSTDQAKVLASTRPPTTPATVTINLDNIIDGKRKRKSLQSPSSSSSATKKSPRVSLRTRAAADSNLDVTDSSASEMSVLKKTVVAKVLDDSSSESTKKPASRQKKATPRTPKKTAARADSVTSSNSDVSMELTTKKQSNKKRNTKQLFSDYAFLLSNADKKFKPEGSEVSESEESILPFDKDELCCDIQSEGGLILDTYEDSASCDRKHVFLLANTFLRTIKYIQCLAAGIPCVKHHWVKNCISCRTLLRVQDFYLPSGYSLLKSSIAEWHGKSDILKDMNIALISDKKSQFVHIWTPVLLAAKANFVQKWMLPTSSPGTSDIVDVLVTNAYCPTKVLASARKRKIPIVSSEWIIQSLVVGERLPFDAHQKFTHNFSE